MPPRLHLTADTDDFDPTLIAHWQSEGFDVTYLPFDDSNVKAYRTSLAHLADDLELGESYALIAYGSAASQCLDFATKPQPHLACLIAYYPTEIPSPKTKYPVHLHVLCHLAASQGFAPAFASYTYSGVQPGFAEHDLDEFSKVAAGLAWSRTLGLVRKAFGIEVDSEQERLREKQVSTQFITKDAAATLRTMNLDAHVTNVPTMTGGIGQKELFIFYRDYFIPSNPPSTSMRLVSRTLGVNRVVDELVFSFKHTQEVPWMLPGVPATEKQVTVPLVSIVGMQGGHLTHEHLYWDQASVLVQVGLLDPKLVPQEMKTKGLKRLPVVGAEAASRILDEESQPSNELIPGWKDRAKGDPGVKMPVRPKQAANGSGA